MGNWLIDNLPHIVHNEPAVPEVKPVPPLPDKIVGNNGKAGGGRENTDLPAADFPGTIEDLTGGNLQEEDGQLVCPNGVRVRPGKDGQGPRIDIPANGSKPHETIHFPPSVSFPTH